MNEQLLVTLGLLLICVVCFVINRPKMEVVALFAMTALPALGILPVKDAIKGFSDSSVVLIGLMFVVGEGLVRTGISADVGSWILKKSGGSETKLIAFMMTAVAIIGSIMSSTGIVALFIPVVANICSQLKISPSKMMMPLCFAALISGMMSLLATPPNMIASEALLAKNFEGFSFFDFTPIGIIVLVVGVFYMIFARRFLGGNDKKRDRVAGTSFGDLIKRYRLGRRDVVLVVRPGSDFVNKKICELPLRQDFGASVVCIERREKRPVGSRRQLIDPEGETVLLENDALLVDFEQGRADADALCKKYDLECLPLNSEKYFKNAVREFGMLEVTVPSESKFEGKTAIELSFRASYGMRIIGILRKRVAITQNVASEPLRAGDMLLLAGSWEKAAGLAKPNKDVLVLTMPEEFKQKTDAPGRAPFAIVSLAVMLVLMAGNIVAPVVAALIGCLLLLATRCIDTHSAFRSVSWATILLIAGMISVATALETTGGVQLAADFVSSTFGNASPHVLLAVLMVFTMIAGLFMSNTATAALLAPIVVDIALKMNYNPTTFAMGLAIAASTAFMTPISSPVNSLVVGPGGYRFMDFVKIGVPFSLIVLIIGIIFIPIFFPFATLN